MTRVGADPGAPAVVGSRLAHPAGKPARPVLLSRILLGHPFLFRGDRITVIRGWMTGREGDGYCVNLENAVPHHQVWSGSCSVERVAG